MQKNCGKDQLGELYKRGVDRTHLPSGCCISTRNRTTAALSSLEKSSRRTARDSRAEKVMTKWGQSYWDVVPSIDGPERKPMPILLATSRDERGMYACRQTRLTNHLGPDPGSPFLTVLLLCLAL